MTFRRNLHWAVQNDCTSFLFIYALRVCEGRNYARENSKCFLKEDEKKETNDCKTLEPTFFHSQRRKRKKKNKGRENMWLPPEAKHLVGTCQTIVSSQSSKTDVGLHQSDRQQRHLMSNDTRTHLTLNIGPHQRCWFAAVAPLSHVPGWLAA